jgi:hypothetical protein
MEMLAYELYLENQENTDEIIKTKVPIKKVFVKTGNTLTIQIDTKSLEEYGDEPTQKEFFRETLSMPYNYLASVGLPNRATGAASKKPYVEFFGTYGKGKLKISVQGEKKSGEQTKPVFEYIFDFETAKEEKTDNISQLTLRLDRKSYFVQDKLLFEVYQDAGIIDANGAVSAEIFFEVCKAFTLFWQEKKVSEQLGEFRGNIRFNIVVLPHLLESDELKIEYRTVDKDTFLNEEEFEDSFGNTATKYASGTTRNAKFVSFDDQAFTINCRKDKDFYTNLGIGNQSFPKINLPTGGGFRISGLDWYFFDLTDPKFHFEKKGSGIYDQLLNNYKLLTSRKGASVNRLSSLKIICVKVAQAKIEVLLDENLTFDQMQKMFSRSTTLFSWHPMAIESLIIKRKNDVIWTNYLAALRCFMNGTFFDRSMLCQYYVITLRENYLWKCLKNGSKEKNEIITFFEASQFCLNLLTQDGNKGLIMNKNEEYAYKIGCIAGKYVKFKRENNEANNSTSDILTYSKYDREKLRFVYTRVGLGISLSKTADISNTDSSVQLIKKDLPTDEIDDAKAHEDYSYFFYKGVFENL